MVHQRFRVDSNVQRSRLVRTLPGAENKARLAASGAQDTGDDHGCSPGCELVSKENEQLHGETSGRQVAIKKHAGSYTLCRGDPGDTGALCRRSVQVHW